MTHHLLAAAATAAVLAGAAGALAALSDAPATPPERAGAEIIAIPVDDPETKAISGLLFEPQGAGPFPAVIYLPGCDGATSASALRLENVLVEDDVGEGEAVLILDSFTARGVPNGVCGRPVDMVFLMRRAEDAYDAAKALAQRPEIDVGRIVLQGYEQGAIAATLAVRPGVAARHGGGVFSGVVTVGP